jgi:hypothetical protein
MTLPSTSDPENLPYFTKIDTGPSFITLLSNTQLKISPHTCQTDIGTHLIQISVFDEEPKSISYSFNLHISN